MPSPSTPPAIHCIGLSKIFRDFWLRPRVRAVRGVDLRIERGQVYGLLGPNGSGKSTTIKMILGLLHPSQGRITVLGHQPRNIQNKKHIGYLPEESYLYRQLTPQETLDLYGKLFGLSAAKRKQRIDMLLELVGLTHVAHRPIGEFSKGMARKVGLAQTLINDPDLVILDEPTSGMDPIAIAETKEIMIQMKKAGKTILLCSHMLSEVEEVCDRIAIMYGGLLRTEGSLEQLCKDSQGQPIRLEQLFLNTVRELRDQGEDTAGATGGRGLERFLKNARALAGLHSTATDLPEESSSPLSNHAEEEVLASLTANSQPSAKSNPVVPAPEIQSEENTRIDVLENLTKSPSPDESKPSSQSSLPPVQPKIKSDANIDALQDLLD